MYKQNITHKLEFMSQLQCSTMLRVMPTSQLYLFINISENFVIKCEMKHIETTKGQKIKAACSYGCLAYITLMAYRLGPVFNPFNTYFIELSLQWISKIAKSIKGIF